MSEVDNKRMNTPIKYKRYDEAFKRSAVEHLLVSGKSVRIIAQELGVFVRRRFGVAVGRCTGRFRRGCDLLPKPDAGFSPV